jgi:membrane protein YqaA with SNARE-associated domain
MGKMSGLYTWAIEKASSPKAPYWIGLIFFLEIFLFLPLDAILMFFCLQNRKNTWFYVAIAAFTSTLSGLIGYFVGHFLWDLTGSYIVPHLISTSSFESLAHHFQAYEKWAVLFGSAFPFPLKALSIGAGVFQLGPMIFAFWMLVGRLARFTLVGSAMYLWGDQVKGFLDRHFSRVVLLICAKIAVAGFFFWAFAR